MNFDYTDELDNYYLVTFTVDGIPFAAQVDKETKQVIDITTLASGVQNASRPYNIDTSLKQIDWLSVNYFEVEDALVEFFTNAN